MVLLLDLPDELLGQICQHVHGQRSLLHLALTSKASYARVLPLLYRSIVLYEVGIREREAYKKRSETRRWFIPSFLHCGPAHNSREGDTGENVNGKTSDSEHESKLNGDNEAGDGGQSDVHDLDGVEFDDSDDEDGDNVDSDDEDSNNGESDDEDSAEEEFTDTDKGSNDSCNHDEENNNAQNDSIKDDADNGDHADEDGNQSEILKTWIGLKQLLTSFNDPSWEPNTVRQLKILYSSQYSHHGVDHDKPRELERQKIKMFPTFCDLNDDGLGIGPDEFLDAFLSTILPSMPAIRDLEIRLDVHHGEWLFGHRYPLTRGLLGLGPRRDPFKPRTMNAISLPQYDLGRQGRLLPSPVLQMLTRLTLSCADHESKGWEQDVSAILDLVCALPKLSTFILSGVDLLGGFTDKEDKIESCCRPKSKTLNRLSLDHCQGASDSCDLCPWLAQFSALENLHIGYYADRSYDEADYELPGLGSEVWDTPGLLWIALSSVKDTLRTLQLEWYNSDRESADWPFYRASICDYRLGNFSILSNVTRFYTHDFWVADLMHDCLGVRTFGLSSIWDALPPRLEELAIQCTEHLDAWIDFKDVQSILRSLPVLLDGRPSSLSLLILDLDTCHYWTEALLKRYKVNAFRNVDIFITHFYHEVDRSRETRTVAYSSEALRARWPDKWRSRPGNFF